MKGIAAAASTANPGASGRRSPAQSFHTFTTISATTSATTWAIPSSLIPASADGGHRGDGEVAGGIAAPLDAAHEPQGARRREEPHREIGVRRAQMNEDQRRDPHEGEPERGPPRLAVRPRRASGRARRPDTGRPMPGASAAASRKSMSVRRVIAAAPAARASIERPLIDSHEAARGQSKG